MQNLKKADWFFIFLFFFVGMLFRLIPKLSLDPHLLTFEADIWYRLCLAQYVLDHQWQLPPSDIRYMAYGHVPVWYNPLSIYTLAFLSHISHLDLPMVASRIMPWIESLTIIPFYIFCSALYQRRVAVLASAFLLLSPSYIFWTDISTLQSFTIFMMPIVILLWVRFVQGQYLLQDRWRHLIVMGVLFAITFLTHLSYFTMMITLAFVQIGLIVERKAKFRDFLYLLVPIALSQILTAPWWLPENLYWWWSTGLTTSSGYMEGLDYLKRYGITSAVWGQVSFAALIIYAIFQRRNLPAFYLVPIFWALFPMLESHNEGFLKMTSHYGSLAWNNFFKPIEGFRFYVFLTLPLAICMALVTELLPKPRPVQKKLFPLVVIAFCGILAYDTMFIYDLPKRLRNAGIDLHDIKAAQWYHHNTRADARILSEYYTAQMFSGICGGKALLGSMFPLKKVKIPYISERNLVQTDIYSVYTSYDINQIRKVLRRYGCTHIYISNKTLFYVCFLTQKSPVIPDVAKIDLTRVLKTLEQGGDFKVVYHDGDTHIIEWAGQ